MERTAEDISSNLKKPKCIALGIGGGALAALMLVTAFCGCGGAWCQPNLQSRAKPRRARASLPPARLRHRLADADTRDPYLLPERIMRRLASENEIETKIYDYVGEARSKDGRPL